MTRTASAALSAILGALIVTTATAEDQKKEAYERDLIADSLAVLDLEPDPHPEGKIIEKVLILRHPIVEKSDPWPDFVNIFHVTTREHIVRQELLFAAGQPYAEELVRESARNLRGLPLLFSTVRIVTAKGSRPDRIVVVVITKDLWSIRINSNFNVGGGVFQFISFMPTEQNFLGYNQQLSLYNRIDRDTYSLAELYRVPRLFGSRLAFMENLGMRMNYHTGELEGGFGEFVCGLPLYSVTSKWGFSVEGYFDIGTYRPYTGANIQQVEIAAVDRTWYLPKILDYRYFVTKAQVVRSFGLKWKTNLKLGYRIRSYTYALPEEFPDVPEEVEQLYVQNKIPADDRAGEIFFSIDFFEATYYRFMNIQTYGLTEDFRFGPQATIEAAWANPAFGFAQQAVKLKLDLGYGLLIGRNILSLKGTLSTRWWPDNEIDGAGTDWVDRWAEAYLENVTPEILGLGRIFVRLRYVYSQHSSSLSELYLGGNNTLRGFVANYTAGERLLNFNLEFRSTPLIFKTLHMGLVVFYDAGDAYGFTQDTDFTYHQSLGIGIRGLFPQFDRGVMRLDIGIPLGRDFHTHVIDWITIAFLQAF